jgi:hypothetical protein
VVVLASDNLTYLPTPQLTTREQPFHTKHLPASYISRPYNSLKEPSFFLMNRIGDAAGDEDLWMKPLARFVSM